MSILLCNRLANPRRQMIPEERRRFWYVATTVFTIPTFGDDVRDRRSQFGQRAPAGVAPSEVRRRVLRLGAFGEIHQKRGDTSVGTLRQT